MKFASLVVILSLCIAGGVGGAGHSSAQQAVTAKMRIGVFDSRSVALAYYRSDEMAAQNKRQSQEYAAAQAAKDEKTIKGMELEASRKQAQTFSVANVSAILEKVRDKLPLIAAEAGVGAVVSRWEVAFASGSVELVDVTRPIVKLFNPTEQTLKMLDQLETKPPVPFSQFRADPTK